MLRVRELAFVTTAAMAAMCGGWLWQAMDLSPATLTTVANKPGVAVKIQQRVALKIAPPVIATPAAIPHKAALAKAAPVLEADADEGGAPDAKQLTPEQLAAQRNELDKQSDGVAARHCKARCPPS